MARNPIQRNWTVEEYLLHEEQTGIKHEYIDGEIFAMSGGTENHSLITANTITELSLQLRGASCRVHTSDMRTKINDARFLYPDLSVVCGEAKFVDEKHTMLTNPTLVVEVTSPTSINYDKGLKGDYYRSLPSLKAYLILDQSSVLAQLYSLQETGWLLRQYEKLDLMIPLPMISCELSLAEVYRDIKF